MSYNSGFFDAMYLGDDRYDRSYSAETFAHYFSLLVQNGVFPDPTTGMQVVASTTPDMYVSVSPGSGWINGYWITVSTPEVLAVPIANPTLNRIDSVVMGLNLVDREIQLYVKTGAVAATPVPATLQRDDNLYELELAQIYVAAGVASITQARITDIRPNTSRCGFVTGLIDQIDTTNLFAQFSSAFENQLEAQDNEFQAWFEDISSQLEGNVAANLQNQINAMQNSSVEGSLQNQINSMKDPDVTGSLQAQINRKIDQELLVTGNCIDISGILTDSSCYNNSNISSLVETKDHVFLFKHPLTSSVSSPTNILLGVIHKQSGEFTPNTSSDTFYYDYVPVVIVENDVVYLLTRYWAAINADGTVVYSSNQTPASNKVLLAFKHETAHYGLFKEYGTTMTVIDFSSGKTQSITKEGIAFVGSLFRLASEYFIDTGSSSTKPSLYKIDMGTKTVINLGKINPLLTGDTISKVQPANGRGSAVIVSSSHRAYVFDKATESFSLLADATEDDLLAASLTGMWVTCKDGAFLCAPSANPSYITSIVDGEIKHNVVHITFGSRWKPSEYTLFSHEAVNITLLGDKLIGICSHVSNNQLICGYILDIFDPRRRWYQQSYIQGSALIPVNTSNATYPSEVSLMCFAPCNGGEYALTWSGSTSAYGGFSSKAVVKLQSILDQGVLFNGYKIGTVL